MYHTHDGRRIKEASPQLQRHNDHHHHHPQGISTMLTNRSEASGLRRESRSSTISSSRKHHRRVLFNEEEILKVLNEYRNQHGSGPLQWSTSCAKRAQGRSDHSAGGQTTEYGENLARSTNARWEDANMACIAAIHHWQREESKYNYDRPGMSSDTSNFTNNVWKLTTHVGFGVGKALYKGKTTYFVVAAFSPKGNQIGDFARNVLPKGSVYDGDQNMVKLATDVDPRYGSQPPHFVRVKTVNTEVRHLTSPNGTYSFHMLPDRNIVVRRAKKIVWESGSKSSYSPPVSTPFRLVLQKNGDLVGYDSCSRVFWSSDTANCGPAPYTLSMRDDGYCVLFDGDWKARWATKIGES